MTDPKVKKALLDLVDVLREMNPADATYQRVHRKPQPTHR